MWHQLELRVEVRDGTITWAAALARTRRVGFGRTAKEAIYNLEQKMAADLRGDAEPESYEETVYFERSARS